MRNIEDILLFRDDISPFLAHLTKATTQASAKQTLEAILNQKLLIAGSGPVSDIRYGGNTNQLNAQQISEFFCAVCFTETPLSEVHCLLDINYRQVNLDPYGLVFLKDRLQKRGVSPVLYLNNELSNLDNVARALFSLTTTHPNEAKELLPLVAVFGKKFWPPGAKQAPAGDVDFRWEREWRYPAAKQNFAFTFEDVFVGMCPDDEIVHFEAAYAPLLFIDPRRPMKWYATKLIQARHNATLKHSVV